MKVAGMPAIIQFCSGMCLLTREFEAITQLLPILVFFKIVTLAAIQTLSLIVISPLIGESSPCEEYIRWASESITNEFQLNCTSSPMTILFEHIIEVVPEIAKLDPTFRHPPSLIWMMAPWPMWTSLSIIHFPFSLMQIALWEPLQSTASASWNPILTMPVVHLPKTIPPLHISFTLTFDAIQTGNMKA